MKTVLAEPAAAAIWPSAPYKGLSFYDPEDALLFAGRELEVRECSRLLEMPGTHVLLLHGLTACGKSSFLRAGLIPLLENSSGGFHFLHDEEDGKRKAWFIRCTDRPMEKLAETVARFITLAPTERETPLGPMPLDLRKALPAGAGDDAEAWVDMLSIDPEALVATMAGIARVMPYTVTFVLDQAEEVLTLDQTEEGEQARELFFEFLASFSRAHLDLKLMLALRTEYYGRFVSRIRRAMGDVLTVREYFLDELTSSQMVAAIKRPTVVDTAPGAVSPGLVYRFRYEDGLAERIAGDIAETVVSGGLTPVLQLVCLMLWERARAKAVGDGGVLVITLADYEAIGGAADQIETHLDRVLLSLAEKQIPAVHLAYEEVDRWKEVLNLLVRTQADGSVTTDIVKRDDLALRCTAVGCTLSPSAVLAALSQPEVRVLREVLVMDRRTRASVLCYSLGHDTLGLALRKWSVVQKELISSALSVRPRQRLIGGVTLAVSIAIAAAGWKFGGTVLSWYGAIALYGAALSALVLWGALAPIRVRQILSPSAVQVTLAMEWVITPKLASRMLTDPAGARTLQAYPQYRAMLVKRSKARTTVFSDYLDTFYQRNVTRPKSESSVKSGPVV